ncbi:MAG: hypothetical protein ACRC2R_08585 [Xenococcaceae cyanobacterium]
MSATDFHNYRSCGIPIAWKVVKATEKGSWKPYWQELLKKSSSTNLTRQVSCFLNSLLTVVARLLNGQSITLGRLHPISFNDYKNFAWSDSS